MSSPLDAGMHRGKPGLKKKKLGKESGEHTAKPSRGFAHPAQE